jgi:small subunit ribosomal protein S17
MTQEHADRMATTADKPQAMVKKTVRRQQKVGRVVSDKMEKTRVVSVETLKRHRIYKRTYKQTKRFHVHDEENRSHTGDLVRIEESRPLSKLKRWRLIEIVKPGSGIVPVEEVLAQANPNLAVSQEESGENAFGSHTTFKEEGEANAFQEE